MQEAAEEAQVVRAGELVANKYRVLERIGAGGMGVVYRAQHEGLGTEVALKFLLPHLARNTTIAERFLREGRIAATLQSTHVIRVLDVDRLGRGIPYIVLEFLHGRSLQRWLDEAKQLPLKTALNIARQAIAGLQVAHSKGIVHRDLKPDNIFACGTPDGVLVKLLDFGIAKIKATTEYQALTKPGMAMGTPEYMAPEQAFSADQADERSDVYAFGCIVYEMLSGKLPVTGSTPQELVSRRLAGEVESLGVAMADLPPSLVALVDSCLQVAPELRPQSAAAIAQELDALTGAVPRLEQSSQPAARPAPILEPTAQMQQVPVAKTVSSPPADSAHHPPAATVDLPAQRRRSGVGKTLALLLLVGAVAAAVVVVWQRPPDPGPPPPMPRPQPSSGLAPASSR